MLRLALQISSTLNLQFNEVLDSNVDELKLLAEEAQKIKQEQAQLYLSIVDYYILKSTQTENESDRESNWDKANEIRAILTGQAQAPKTLLGGKSLNNDQLLEFMQQRQEKGITYAQFVQKYL